MIVTQTASGFTVNVEWDDTLLAPTDYAGQPRKWLPCNVCNKLTAVGFNIVSFVCTDCAANDVDDVPMATIARCDCDACNRYRGEA